MLAIFLDIETTGLDPQVHRTVDLAFRVVDLNTYEIIESYQSIVKQPYEEWLNHDPVSLKINGYTWDMINQGLPPETVKEQVIEIFSDLKIVRGNSVFICQNPAFDRVFLTQLIPIPKQEELKWPYHWLDLASMYWALLLKQCNTEQKAFPSNMTLSKNEIAERFGIPPESSPHKAMNGVDHLMACYEAVLNVKFQSKP
ncbi:MAG: 3'-5' exonuclease [Chlamydiota bacterium]